MNILIVGPNSYIGRCIGNWFLQKEHAPKIDYISVRNDQWKHVDLTGYDAVIFAAAIVHQKHMDDWTLYEKVNAKLPYEFAATAKAQKVRHFIFISTAAVFAASKSLPLGTVISHDTPLTPNGMYGRSKLLGEQMLLELRSKEFHVSFVRPMNVYGKNCQGNYIPLFTKLTKLLPVLPNAFGNVKQGMLYIDNLAELCWLIAHSEQSGVYMAQDEETVSAYEIMNAISNGVGVQKPAIRCSWFFRLFYWFPLVQKLFGGIAYSQEISTCPLGNYRVVDFREGMRRTVSEK